MSDYYKSLDDKAKARYKKKLEMAGLTVQNDPCAPVNHEKFKDEIWLCVHQCTLAYFIRRPRVYTQEQLLSWKQLDAYKYFQSGYVRTVYLAIVYAQRLRSGCSVSCSVEWFHFSRFYCSYYL